MESILRIMPPLIEISGYFFSRNKNKSLEETLAGDIIAAFGPCVGFWLAGLLAY
jgi:hypothetical protein